MVPELVVAMTLWGECRGEPFAGKAGVASVMLYQATDAMGRREASSVGEALKKVCLAKAQFSCWNADGRFTQPAPYPSIAWTECWQLATQLVAGNFKPTLKANHYHALYADPAWATSMTKVAEIGRHVFYKD